MKYWLVTQFTELDQLDALAQQAEKLGFYGLMLGDHFVSFDQQSDQYAYTDDGGQLWQHDTHWPDPWVQIAALSKITSTLKFMTSVYVLPMHETISAAKAIGTAAYISNGRIMLGVGTGWQQAEFELVGRQFEKRGRIMDEQIDIMQQLWTGEMVEYHGQYHDFERLQMSPPPGVNIPLYGSGLAPVALRRSAQMSGWIAPSAYTTDQVNSLIEPVQSAVRDAGRNLDDFEIILTSMDPTPDNINRLEDMGVGALMACPWMKSRQAKSTSLEYKLEKMETFANYFL